MRLVLATSLSLALAPASGAARATSAAEAAPGATAAGPGPGERLAVTTAGAGTPVVIVTGVLGSAYGFRKVIPALTAGGFRVTTVDPLGFGASPRPDGADYSTVAQAARVAQAIEQTRSGPAIMVCHALAGPICLRLAYRRPDLVKGIVSINGGASEQAGSTEMRLALTFARVALFFTGRSYAIHKLKDGLIESSGNASWVTDDVVAHYVQPFGSDVRQVVRSMQDILAAHEPEPLRPNLGRVRAPVVLLYGPTSHDPKNPSVSPEERATLRTSLHNFEEVDVAGAGQFIQEEQPRAVVAAIERMRARTR